MPPTKSGRRRFELKLRWLKRTFKRIFKRIADFFAWEQPNYNNIFETIEYTHREFSRFGDINSSFTMTEEELMKELKRMEKVLNELNRRTGGVNGKTSSNRRKDD